MADFDIAAFRAQFPEFSSETAYPDAVLTSYWDMSHCYITEPNDVLKDACLTLSYNLMTAHIAKDSTQAADGGSSGLVQSSSIGSVSISSKLLDTKTEFQFWLSKTSYGVQLLSLFSLQSAGGFLVGGLPESSAFRKVYGIR